MDLRSRIVAHFEQVAQEHKNTLAPLTDDLVLLDCGLDSLCFAVIAARLEDELGFDPFGEGGGAEYPVTFGEFVRLYEDAAG
jgi:Phosphopantetheine attachment site